MEQAAAASRDVNNVAVLPEPLFPDDTGLKKKRKEFGLTSAKKDQILLNNNDFNAVLGYLCRR